MSRWELLRLVRETLLGEYGNGKEREMCLPNYEAVQDIVNCILKHEDRKSYEAECSKENIRAVLKAIEEYECREHETNNNQSNKKGEEE